MLLRSGGTRTTKQPSLPPLEAPPSQRVRCLGVIWGSGLDVLKHDMLPVCSPRVGFCVWKCTKRGTSSIAPAGEGAPPFAPKLSVSSERFGIFHKIECDNDII